MRVVAVALVFVVAGCPSRNRDEREAVAKMIELKDKMCACKDKACADKVQNDMTAWATEMAENASRGRDRDRPPDEQQMKRMVDIGTQYGECMTHAMTGKELPAERPEPEPVVSSCCLPIPECEEYRLAVERVETCEKIPAATRQRIREAYDQAAKAVAILPSAGRKEAVPACTAAASATNQAAAVCP